MVDRPSARSPMVTRPSPMVTRPSPYKIDDRIERTSPLKCPTTPGSHFEQRTCRTPVRNNYPDADVLRSSGSRQVDMPQEATRSPFYRERVLESPRHPTEGYRQLRHNDVDRMTGARKQLCFDQGYPQPNFTGVEQQGMLIWNFVIVQLFSEYGLLFDCKTQM